MLVPYTVAMVTVYCESCRANSLTAVSSSHPIKLLGNCSNCVSANIQYKWSVIRDDGIYLLLNDETTTTGGSSQNLVIRRGSLADSHSYSFRLNVTSEEFVGQGFAEILLTPARPPSGGYCVILAPTVSF